VLAHAPLHHNAIHDGFDLSIEIQTLADLFAAPTRLLAAAEGARRIDERCALTPMEPARMRAPSYARC